MGLTRFKILLLGSFALTLIFGPSLVLKAIASNDANGGDILIPTPKPVAPTPSTPTGSPVTEEDITNAGTYMINPYNAANQESTSIIMHLIPTNPAPGENVTVDISSYAENLNTSKIDWVVDGKVVSSGTGLTSIIVQAPAAGGAMTIVAKIAIDAKTKTQISMTIRPAEMALLWEATDSYVPPFYKGKALPTADTFIKVVAMPEIKTANGMVKHSNLVYSWEKDFTNAQSSSGYGKEFFIYKNDYLDNSNNIGVIASSVDQKYSSQARINITPITPKLSFYKEDSAGIMWDNALKSPHRIRAGGNATDETIVAVPYYISPSDIRRPDLMFNWSINNVPINVSTSQKNIMPLKVQGDIAGASDIKLEISNRYQFFQNTSGLLRVEF